MVDCDSDTILYIVELTGSICHTGNISCFFRELNGSLELENKYTKSIVDEIISYFEKSKIVKRKWVKDKSRKYYEYIVNPITDNIPPSPRVVSWIAHKIKLDNFK